MIAQEDVIKLIMSTSVSIVALSMPVLAFLFSQMMAKKGFASEARPYKVLASFFVFFLMMGVFSSFLSFSILTGLVSADFSVYTIYSFLATLLLIPAAIIIAAILVLRSD